MSKSYLAAPRAAKGGELRMYFISMRHLSGIQKGIQSIHATAVYSNEHGNSDIWKKWSTEDHTVVLLEGNVYSEDGPTSTYNVYYFMELLKIYSVRHSFFREPDLSNSFTSVGFILDERFFNSEKYPDKVFEKEEDKFFFYSGYEGSTELSKEDILEIGFIVYSIRESLKQFKLASN